MSLLLSYLYLCLLFVSIYVGVIVALALLRSKVVLFGSHIGRHLLWYEVAQGRSVIVLMMPGPNGPLR